MPTITAEKARQIVETSNKLMQQRLDAVCESIRKEATLGSRELLLKPYMPDGAAWMQVEEPSAYRAPEFTPVQRKIKEELEQLGFNVCIYTYDITIGGGLGDPEPGRTCQAHAIQIRW